MKKALKELIENATTKTEGVFFDLLFVSNGKYDGFWGVNGYDKILLFGKDAEDKQYYKIADHIDVVEIWLDRHVQVDIPTKYGVPRLNFNAQPFKVNYNRLTSALIISKESE